MEEKNTLSFLKIYYQEKKPLIEVIGFVGVVAGLFLQITQFQSDALRAIQAFLLLVLTLLLTYLLIEFLYKLFFYQKETPKSIVLYSWIFSMTVGVFIFNLFKFILFSFNEQLLILLRLSKFGILFILFLYFRDITKFFSHRFGNERFWLIMNELFFGTLLCIFFSNKLYIDTHFLKSVVLLMLINIAFIFKLISSGTLMCLIVVVPIFYTAVFVWADFIETFYLKFF